MVEFAMSHEYSRAPGVAAKDMVMELLEHGPLPCPRMLIARTLKQSIAEY